MKVYKQMGNSFKSCTAEHLVENNFTDCPKNVFHQIGVCGSCFKTVNISIQKLVLSQKFSFDKIPAKYLIEFEG